MKILVVHHQMRLYGGAELVVVRLAHYLQEHGHKVTILAASTSPHLEYEGLDIITPRKEIPWRLWDGTPSSLQELGQVFIILHKLCRELAGGYDVVNAHNFPSIWAAPHYKKIVWMCNEVPDLWHRDHISGITEQILKPGKVFDRYVVHRKARTSLTAVVPDERCAERFQHRYGLEPRVIPYGIDGEFFSQGATADKPDKFTVMQPSMISPSKGQLEVLRATKGLDVRVIFAGYYEPRHPYTAKVFQCAAGREVYFAGHIGKAALRALYHQAYVAVFPGKGQGSWLGPFEALATGTPVIVSPNLSCSGLIRREGLGIVTDDIVEALQTVRDHYPLYRMQALRGQEFVLRSLTWNNFGARMTELMEK